MRVGGGALRGRGLRVAAGVRPTAGMARAALFDIWGPRLTGARFLDLFAGSGAVGIEALSRGADSCVAVEGAAGAFKVLSANYETLLPEAGWHLVRASLPRGLGQRGLREGGRFDLVFADPPYGFEPWRELLGGIAPLVAAGGEVALEHGRRNRPPAGSGPLERSRRRTYGETELSFYELSKIEPSPGARPR